MKTMLITGASKGIGYECWQHFKNDFNIITISRTGNPTIKGDLSKIEFVKEIIRDLNIDVLINNAGIISESYEETFDLNVQAAFYLAAGFYQKMKSGHIVNICSTASHMRGWKNMPVERIWYLASKASIKDLGIVLQNSKINLVKVTNIEPGWVNTDFANAKVSQELLLKGGTPKPIDPQEIAKAIQWILNQPAHININTLQIDNFPLA